MSGAQLPQGGVAGPGMSHGRRYDADGMWGEYGEDVRTHTVPCDDYSRSSRAAALLEFFAA